MTGRELASRGGGDIAVPTSEKNIACERINEFLSLTPEAILSRPILKPYKDTPNRRLANAMLGLDTAVTTLRQENPPVENGEWFERQNKYFDSNTGEIVDSIFGCHKAGSDFGTFLHIVKNNTDPEADSQTEPYTGLLLPQDRYLVLVQTLGDPHEPQFYACEPDIYTTEEWSASEHERVPKVGGIAHRKFSHERSWRMYDDYWGRHQMYYKPLYSEGAEGIEGYLRILQAMLAELVRGF